MKKLSYRLKTTYQGDNRRSNSQGKSKNLQITLRSKSYNRKQASIRESAGRFDFLHMNEWLKKYQESKEDNKYLITISEINRLIDKQKCAVCQRYKTQVRNLQMRNIENEQKISTMKYALSTKQLQDHKRKDRDKDKDKEERPPAQIKELASLTAQNIQLKKELLLQKQANRKAHQNLNKLSKEKNEQSNELKLQNRLAKEEIGEYRRKLAEIGQKLKEQEEQLAQLEVRDKASPNRIEQLSKLEVKQEMLHSRKQKLQEQFVRFAKLSEQHNLQKNLLLNLKLQDKMVEGLENRLQLECEALFGEANRDFKKMSRQEYKSLCNQKIRFLSYLYDQKFVQLAQIIKELKVELIRLSSESQRNRTYFQKQLQIASHQSHAFKQLKAIITHAEIEKDSLAKKIIYFSSSCSVCPELSKVLAGVTSQLRQNIARLEEHSSKKRLLLDQSLQ